jgi:SAM-dependent methyltransferase
MAPGSYYVNARLGRYKAGEYARLLLPLAGRRFSRALKTDLYEEAHALPFLWQWLSQRSGQVVSIDRSSAIARGAARELDALRLPGASLVADCRALPFADGSFDLVVSPSTFDHFAAIEAAIAETHRVLEPGGTLVITLNNRSNPFFVLNSYLLPRLGLLRFTNYHYTRRQATRLLERGGFRVRHQTTILHLPFLYPSLSNLLQRLGGLGPWLDARCVELVGRITHTPLAALVAWHVAFIAEKRSVGPAGPA